MKTGSIQFQLIRKQNNTTEMVVFYLKLKTLPNFGSVFLYYLDLAAFLFAFTPFLL